MDQSKYILSIIPEKNPYNRGEVKIQLREYTLDNGIFSFENEWKATYTVITFPPLAERPAENEMHVTVSHMAVTLGEINLLHKAIDFKMDNIFEIVSYLNEEPGNDFYIIGNDFALEFKEKFRTSNFISCLDLIFDSIDFMEKLHRLKTA